MQILLIMLIVIFLAFSVLLLALAKQSPREKQTEDKEQEEYIRDYAETVRQTGGSMKKLEHWKVIAIYLIIYDMIAVNFSYFMALLVRFDFRYSSIPTDYFAAWRSFAPIYTIIILVVFGCMHLYNSVWRFASSHELIKITVATVITGVLHIVGITIFWERMPASYYLIGIMLQFFLTVGVRFSYRFVLLERNRREKSEREERSKNVMIIGAGEAGRTIVRELQNSNHNMGVVRLWSAGIVNLIVAIFLYIYICRRGKKYVDSILWKSTLFVAVPLIPHYLSTVVLSSIDKIMISQMISQNKTGIYSLAAILSAIGVLIWRALSVTYTPFVNSKLGERDFLSIREAVKPLLLVVAAFCILTALAAPEIIGILATKEYYEGIYVVPPIAAGIYTTALYDNFTAISFFHKKSFNIMIATVIAAISNVIMNYVFIMKCGYIAAGYTTLASNLILTALHYINSRKIEKEKVYDFKFCLLSVLVVTISCLLCNLIYKFTWVRYGVILIIILIVFKFRNKLINSITAMKV